MRSARASLRGAGVESPGREASLLLGILTGWSEAQVIARSDVELSADLAAELASLLARRASGEPFAYLAGAREFFGRPFRVDPRVLIPRPETELLVAAVLELPLPPAPRILDVGTGSGAIAVTLARELPAASVVASDISPAALAVARRNAQALDARIHFVATDLALALRLGSFDVVVSNPPYIAVEDSATLPATVRDFEPALALFAGDRGLAVVDRLLAAGEDLPLGAFLLFEIGAGQSASLRERVAARARFELLAIAPDHAGIPRVVVLKRRPA
jgi:release factor glutamine methyltransferase